MTTWRELPLIEIKRSGQESLCEKGEEDQFSFAKMWLGSNSEGSLYFRGKTLA